MLTKTFVCCVPVRFFFFFFFHCPSFLPYIRSHFLFSFLWYIILFFQQNSSPLFFYLSLLALCHSFSRWAPLACHLLSRFLFLSLSLHSKFVDLDDTDIETISPFDFFFIDSSHGHVISRQKISSCIWVAMHVDWVTCMLHWYPFGADGRAYGLLTTSHYQNFAVAWITKFSYFWCSAIKTVDTFRFKDEDEIWLFRAYSHEIDTPEIFNLPFCTNL